MHHPDVHKIEEHMQVVGADGVPVGIVDGLDGDLIKLTRASGGGHHRYVPPDLVAHVRGGVVMLHVSAEAAQERITTDETDGMPPAARGGAASGMQAQAGRMGGHHASEDDI